MKRIEYLDRINNEKISINHKILSRSDIKIIDNHLKEIFEAIERKKHLQVVDAIKVILLEDY